MKPSSSLLLLLALLLAPWQWAAGAGRQAPGLLLSSSRAADAPGACGSSQEDQKVKQGSESPWTLAYVPRRSCHRVLKDKYGEFSPPASHADLPLHFWCKWTIWAGSRQHIIIYIQGFTTKESCSQNEEKILFEGVSSLVEDSVLYACWKKETHVFATFAQAVHIVLLKSYLPSCRDTQFKGKYYIFQEQEGESPAREDGIPGTTAPKLEGSFQSGWAGSLRGFATPASTTKLGKTMVLSREWVQSRGSMLDTVAMRSPAEIVPYEHARTPLLERKAPSGLESELPGDARGCKEAQGRGTPEGIIPTAGQESWGQSEDTTRALASVLSGVPWETPVLSASLQVAEVALERSQAVLHPTLRPKDLGDLQLTVKPTCTSCLDLAAHSQSLFSPGRRDSQESRDATTSPGRSTDSLEKGERHPQGSGPTAGLAKGLMPSLRSPGEVLQKDHSQLPERRQRVHSSCGDLSMTQPELGTTELPFRAIPSPDCVRGALEGRTALQPTPPGEVLQEHPHLGGQKSQVLQPSSADPGSIPPKSQAQDLPAAQEAPASSLGVKCQQSSGRAAEPGLPASPWHTPTATSTLGAELTPPLLLSCTGPLPAGFGPTDLTPEAPPAPEGEPESSIVSSPAAAVDLDPVRQRAGTSPAGPGGQEMGSSAPLLHPSVGSSAPLLHPSVGSSAPLLHPSVGSSAPLLHPSVASEAGAKESPGMQKLVLEGAGGQPAESSAPMGSSSVSISSPKLAVELPQPEDHVSSGSGVASVSLPGTWEGTREEHVVPVEHQGMAAGAKLASASILGGFKMQQSTEAPQVGAGEQRDASSSATPAHPGPPVAQWGVSERQKAQEPSDDPASRSTQKAGGQQEKPAELGPPWAVEYLPSSTCHKVFQDASGIFYLPLHADIATNIWCNWTILAGSQRHIVIYIQGFQGRGGCGKNQDKIIFQGLSSSVETKVVYACHNQGTLVFAAEAAAVQILLLSGAGSLSSDYGHFKGQYHVFRSPETLGSSDDTTAPQEPVQKVSKEESWRMAVTKGFLPMLRASAGPSHALAGGRIQPEHVSPDEEAQQPSDLVGHAQSDADLSEPDTSKCEELQDETELESSLQDGGTEVREAEDDVLVELPPTRQDAGLKAGLSPLESAKGDGEVLPALVSAAPCRPGAVPSSEVASSTAAISAKSPSLQQPSSSLAQEEAAAAAHPMQTPVLEEPVLRMSTKAAAGVTAAKVTSPGASNEELLDLLSALASLENETALQTQHHPGDVLFEVTVEIQPKDWIPHAGSELQKGLLEFMKNYIQENVRLSASRVSEIKLKEARRTSNASLLLTFWLHLKPEERNVSLLLRSQLEELLGASVGEEKLQLVSLLVEDVDECSAGLNLCGEEAECFNGVGTYLCRCKRDYEDHSPTKSGTLCIHAPPSGLIFLQHADILVGAALMAVLAMLVAAGAMYRAGSRGQCCRRKPSPEEQPVRTSPLEEPAMELHHLGDCLNLDPFQLKLRARTPEWLWGARAQPGQPYQVFLEQSSPL